MNNTKTGTSVEADTVRMQCSLSTNTLFPVSGQQCCGYSRFFWVLEATGFGLIDVLLIESVPIVTHMLLTVCQRWCTGGLCIRTSLENQLALLVVCKLVLHPGWFFFVWTCQISFFGG